MRVLFFSVFIILAQKSWSQSHQTFVINTFWNGTTLPDGKNVTLTLSGATDSRDITLQITAPFYDDPVPAGAAGQSFYGLRDYEVVEVFFLNDANQYLEVAVGPYGQYIVLLLNGVRNVIRHSIPLSPVTSITSDKWTGTVVIPGDYLPSTVTKFNAYAINGAGADRKYWSLYAADNTTSSPDFHALQFFQPINTESLSPALATATISTLWENALKGLIKYTIDKTWDGQPIEGDIPVTLIMTSGPNPGDVSVNITAPFFIDAEPNGQPGQPFIGLWDYEVVEVFFLNDQNQYLEVEIGPFGHHIVLMLSGIRNTIRHSLPLNVTTARGRHIWHGTAVIPGDYLPPKVTKFNAYAIHGNSSQRIYWSLYPTDGTTSSPDFHNLQFFNPIDLDSISPANKLEEPSPLWKNAIQGIILYELDSQWNGRSSTVGRSVVTLQGFQGGVEVNFTVANGVRFMPLRYATLIFKNVDNESLKLILEPTEKHSVTLASAKNVLVQETSALDFRVVTTDNLVKASILIPPDYFPPNVTLLNAYFTFGISVLEVISLQPTVIHEDQVDVTTNFESPDHFLQIDFPTVIENNEQYSIKWHALGLAPVQAAAPKLSEQPRISLPLTVSKEAANFDDSAAAQVEHVDKSEGMEEITLTENDGTKVQQKFGMGDVDQKSVAENVKAMVQQENEAIDVDQKSVAENDKAMVQQENVAIDVDHKTVAENDKAMVQQENEAIDVDQKTVAENDKAMVQQNEAIDVDQKSIAENDKAMVQQENVAIDVDQKSVAENDKAMVQPGNETKDVAQKSVAENDKAMVQQENEAIDVDQKSVAENDKAMVQPDNETKDVARKSVAENDKDMVQQANDTKDVDQKSVAKNSEATAVENKVSASVGETSLDDEILIVTEKTKVDEGKNMSSNREEAQRRIEDDILDKNVLQIPFKISFISQDEKLDQESPSLITSIVDHESTTIVPSINNPQITSNVPSIDDQQSTDTVPGVNATQSVSTIHNVSKQPVKKEDFEDTVDRLLDMLDSGTSTAEDDYDLLPPPHPICFTPGLVPDSFRCQVFYECVIENGKWEVYNWRCKRGYFYDSQKVACIRGYC